MTDLGTRLLALAAEVDPLWPETITGEQITQVSCALREAADALKETTSKLNHESYCHDKAAQDRTKAERERGDLKAKLADAEKRPTWEQWEALKAAHEQSWQEREARWTAKLAEEAKRLNDAGMDFWRERSRAEKAEAEAAKHMSICLGWQEKALKAEAESAALREALEVIAAPLPEDYGWSTKAARKALSQPGPGAALLERVRKLEDALRFYADPKTHELDDANGYYPDASFPIHDDNGDRARAALEEKP